MTFIHTYPVVRVDGITLAEMEEFADYMPEGVVLKKNPGVIECLCAVDMEATAEANGYTVRKGDAGLYIFVNRELPS